MTAKKISLEILRRRQVEKITGLSRSSIYAKMKKGSSTYDATFPLKIRLSDSPNGNGAVGWLAEDVQRWLELRIKASRPEQAADSNQGELQ